MSPRDSPPAFKNAEPRTSSADDYLHHLAEEIIPVTEAEIHRAPQWCGIAGYSLTGLFALYAIYMPDQFSRTGSMSGSHE